MNKIIDWLVYIVGLLLSLTLLEKGDHGLSVVVLVLSNILLQLNYIYYEIKK